MKAALVLYSFLATGIIATIAGVQAIIQKYSVNLDTIVSLNPSSLIDSVGIPTLGPVSSLTLLGAILLSALLLVYGLGLFIFHSISKRRS
ncbi:MAG: hypothetical protein R6U44_09920 [Archaeoglobaceae archaeon]